MAYVDFMSKTEDVVWLAYKLKDELGGKISINKVGLCKNYLEGKYNLDHIRSVNFAILYSDKEFLRVSVGEVGAYASSYEDKVVALNGLKTAIGRIVRDGVSLGEPSIFYNVRDEEYVIPSLEYIYADKEAAIKEFKDKTIFDDDGIPEDVIVFDSINDRDGFTIKKEYSYDKKIYDNDYSVIVDGKYLSNCDIDNKILELLIIENLDNLFMVSNKKRKCEVLDKYLSISGELSYIIASIRNCSSFVTESELSVSIMENGKVMQSASYINGILCSYTGISNLSDCILNTTYGVGDGIRFETKSDFESSKYVQALVEYEYKNLYNLINYNNKSEIKDNSNLLKLVRRIGNK